MVVRGTRGRYYGLIRGEPASHSQQTHSARVLDSTTVTLSLQLGYSGPRLPEHIWATGSVWVGGLGSFFFFFFADDVVAFVFDAPQGNVESSWREPAPSGSEAAGSPELHPLGLGLDATGREAPPSMFPRLFPPSEKGKTCETDVGVHL